MSTTNAGSRCSCHIKRGAILCFVARKLTLEAQLWHHHLFRGIIYGTILREMASLVTGETALRVTNHFGTINGLVARFVAFETFIDRILRLLAPHTITSLLPGTRERLMPSLLAREASIIQTHAPILHQDFLRTIKRFVPKLMAHKTLITTTTTRESLIGALEGLVTHLLAHETGNICIHIHISLHHPLGPAHPLPVWALKRLMALLMAHKALIIRPRFLNILLSWALKGLMPHILAHETAFGHPLGFHLIIPSGALKSLVPKLMAQETGLLPPTIVSLTSLLFFRRLIIATIIVTKIIIVVVHLLVGFTIVPAIAFTTILQRALKGFVAHLMAVKALIRGRRTKGTLCDAVARLLALEASLGAIVGTVHRTVTNLVALETLIIVW